LSLPTQVLLAIGIAQIAALLEIQSAAIGNYLMAAINADGFAKAASKCRINLVFK
jgi:hypothetical protein